MRKHLIIVFALFLFGFTARTQNSPKLDNFGRIILNTYLPEQIDISADARKLLDTKLSQVTSNYGMGGSSVNPRFIITASINVGTKDIIAGPPQMIAQNLDITIFIGDAIENKIFGNITTTLKGVGTNKNKAFIDAIKKINPKNKVLASLIEEGKTKIITYFNTQCDFTITEAMTLKEQGKYEEAIYKLSIVPEVCQDCYFKSKDLLISVYENKIDADCEIRLNKARTEWSGQKNIDKAERVLDILSEINPSASCFNEVNLLTKEINDKLIADEKVRLELALKEYNDKLDLEKKTYRCIPRSCTRIR